MRVFFDSGVLLTAWDARRKESEAALAALEDEHNEICTSDLVRLELIPKATFFKKHEEIAFYEAIFARAVDSQPLDEKLFLSGFSLAKQYGIAAVDALNIAAAILLDAKEFITTESPAKPLFRVRKIKVTTLHAASK